MLFIQRLPSSVQSKMKLSFFSEILINQFHLRQNFISGRTKPLRAKMKNQNALLFESLTKYLESLKHKLQVTIPIYVSFHKVSI